MEEREQAGCVSHPVLLEMGKELQGMIGALLFLLQLPAVLALARCADRWLGVDLCRLLCNRLALLCWTPACLASLSCLPSIPQNENKMVHHSQYEEKRQLPGIHCS